MSDRIRKAIEDQDPLETFVDQAMYIHSIRQKPLSEVRKQHERLVAAVFMFSRQKLLDQLKEEGKIEKDY